MNWSFYKKTLFKVIAVVLVAVIIAPSIYYSIPPKKAEAAISTCLSGYLSKIAEVFAEKTVAAVASVPVSDNGEVVSSAEQSAGSRALSIKECLEKPLAYAIARMILDQITNDLVTWINSGFEGQPAFVTDPGKFMMNIGDQVIGDIILGSNLAFLCSPFKVQIQLALALNYSAGGSSASTASCTLSDVFNNVDNAFSDFAEGGWQGWFEITQSSSNNPYGSILNAVGEIGVRVNNKQAKEAQKLSWGDGFFSYETCENMFTGEVSHNTGGTGKSNLSVGQSGVVETEDAMLTCKVETPGNAISASLNNQLGVDTEALNLADDLDRIFQALMGQLMKQVFGGVGGLLGASETTQNNYNQSSSIRESEGASYSANLQQSAQAGSYSGGAGVPTGTGGTNSQPGSPAQNIAVNKKVTSSPVSVDDGNSYEALKIVDGNKSSSFGNGDFSGLITQRQSLSNPVFVMINLGSQMSGIINIDVYERTNPSNSSYNDVLKYVVQILDKNQVVVWESPQQTQDFSGLKEINVLATGGKAIDGQYIRLIGKSAGRLEIAEVEVYQNQLPSIQLKGGSVITLIEGSPYSEPGYTAYDNQDGDLTAYVQKSGSVDINTVGSYESTYSVSDSAGGSITVTRTVIIQAKIPTYSTNTQ